MLLGQGSRRVLWPGHHQGCSGQWVGVLGGQGLAAKALVMRSRDFGHEVAAPGPGAAAGLCVLGIYSASITFKDKDMLVFYCPLSSSEAPSGARRKGKDSFPYDGGLVTSAWPSGAGLRGSLLHHATLRGEGSSPGAQRRRPFPTQASSQPSSAFPLAACPPRIPLLS